MKKHKKLKVFLIVVLVLVVVFFVAKAIVSHVITEKQIAAMDDPFACAQEQMFELDPDDISCIAVQNGNGEYYEFTGDEFEWALEKLNSFRAEEIYGIWLPKMSGWTYRIIIKDAAGNFGSYDLFDSALKCDDVIFSGEENEFSEFIKYVSLDR